MRPILYYVHHQGSGHWRRALAMAEQLPRPVIFASSAQPPRDLPPSCEHVPLPLDFGPVNEGPDAHGALHWAPTHQPGLLARHRLLLSAAAHHQPVLAVVDVSVEIAVLLRTSGIPVVAVRLPGQRTDPAHNLGFALADQVVMPVPESWGLHTNLPRTHAVGLVTAARRVLKSNNNGRPRAVVVVGTGGSRLDARRCAEIAVDLPDHEVTVLGLDAPAEAGPANLSFQGRVADAGPAIAEASVVIGNTGLGTVGEVTTAGKPFVTLPEQRAFDEQEATAKALDGVGAAVALWQLPEPGGWADAVRRAMLLPEQDEPEVGAARFAQLVEAQAVEVETV
ncbi:hypothetical protein Kisp01_21980 [Kineosporia sp. NBRC 101677]|uniref:glycosyltransferase n=1 Tax=Kineosporia sp. NBRC 101677 TaxID=3032197 RepID=UPI0024A50E93|nr:glycosyltransferase [Kineosporia sp. NBRC 101677]GLY15183.1 hypothetical protein Kisp01_21980 [Kineosporia sp. NBRC 101677]